MRFVSSPAAAGSSRSWTAPPYVASQTARAAVRGSGSGVRLDGSARLSYSAMTSSTLMGRDYYKAGSSGSSQLEAYYCEHFLSWLDAARTIGAGWNPDRHGEAMRRLGRAYLPVLNNAVDWL